MPSFFLRIAAGHEQHGAATTSMSIRIKHSAVIAPSGLESQIRQELPHDCKPSRRNSSFCLSQLPKIQNSVIIAKPRILGSYQRPAASPLHGPPAGLEQFLGLSASGFFLGLTSEKLAAPLSRQPYSAPDGPSILATSAGRPTSADSEHHNQSPLPNCKLRNGKDNEYGFVSDVRSARPPIWEHERQLDFVIISVKQ